MAFRVSIVGPTNWLKYSLLVTQVRNCCLSQSSLLCVFGASSWKAGIH